MRMGPESIIPPNKQTRKEYLRGGGNTGAGGSYDSSTSYLDSPGGGDGSGSPGGQGGVQFALASESMGGGTVLFGSPGSNNAHTTHPFDAHGSLTVSPLLVVVVVVVAATAVIFIITG